MNNNQKDWEDERTAKAVRDRAWRLRKDKEQKRLTDNDT
jgi:hypothetical protein|tara:strand:+ start:739 stop:855 length:117 start_codon:yes stop_codon:yes gene_type:complete